MTLKLSKNFSLAHAVCSYGYFVLAPNRWVPDTKDGPIGKLERPLLDEDGKAVRCTITQHKTKDSLTIKTNRKLSREGMSIIKHKVARMLRLNEDFSPFHKLHKQAKRKKFDCIFRSPTVFEDMVKTITSCNVAWRSTRIMNQRLCERYGTGGAFPSAAELAVADEAELKAFCRVGYRAERIIRLAKTFTSGELEEAWFDDPLRNSDELYTTINALYGFGPYATNNCLQLLGHYDRLAMDSEVIRHFKESHQITGKAKEVEKKAMDFYAQYAPYQFLAYWYELWDHAQQRNGPAWRWTAEGGRTSNQIDL